MKLEYGRVSEWFKELVLKTSVGVNLTVGSNPTPSATTGGKKCSVGQLWDSSRKMVTIDDGQSQRVQKAL